MASCETQTDFDIYCAKCTEPIEDKNIMVFGSAAQADLPNIIRIFGSTLTMGRGHPSSVY